VYLNGAYYATTDSTDLGGVYAVELSLAVLTLAATDTIKIVAFQSSGGAINIVSRLEIIRFGP
jgi:cobalamin biosynthesis protein CbiG